MNNSSSLSSPKESESGGSLTFKTLKKKIRNKFRLSRAEEGTKTIAQAVETLRRSNELLTEGVTETDDSEALKSEFKGKDGLDIKRTVFIVYRIKGNTSKYFKSKPNSF